MIDRENIYSGFDCNNLEDSCLIHTGRLPAKLNLDSSAFESLWKLHPTEYHTIKIMGRLVKTPRWQQAYGMDYYYTGRMNIARPVPRLLTTLLAWAQEMIDERLNGILVNWYDGSLKHYIGKHRDSIKNMMRDTPIVTISFGEERVFRLRPKHGTGHKDYPARDGSVFIMQYETNRLWTHEVPHLRRFTGRRISVTLRGFIDS